MKRAKIPALLPLFAKSIYMVFGGFHHVNKSDLETESVNPRMKAPGAERCGATHCTGDKQIKIFRERPGSDFIDLGVGNTLIVSP